MDGELTPCQINARKNGILIPMCPPRNEIQVKGPAEYWLLALANRRNYKGTYDCQFQI